VTLAGRFGAYPPHDEAGFFAFAKSLYTPKLYHLIKDVERLTEITYYRFPTSVQRHYERLTTFPAGFVVLGDAISSFNPVYGQGMSSAALQVKALQQLLTERATEVQGLADLAQFFFPKAAEIIATPWTLAATQDWAYPQTRELPVDGMMGLTQLGTHRRHLWGFEPRRWQIAAHSSKLRPPWVINSASRATLGRILRYRRTKWAAR
jgi:2-polyprenyl-6-methoxyphenol hydroxylase-like FAD-dependent oxidoreductase